MNVICNVPRFYVSLLTINVSNFSMKLLFIVANELKDHTDEYYRFRALLSKTPKTWSGVFIRFAEYTSFQGIPFIYRSRYTLARLIWISFFIFALVCTLVHYYLVASKFLEKGVTTKVTVGYSDLPFPSVTFCNINPIRQSAVTDNIQPLSTFLKDIEPPSESRTNAFQRPGSPCQPRTRAFGDFGPNGEPPGQGPPPGFPPPPGPLHRRGRRPPPPVFGRRQYNRGINRRGLNNRNSHQDNGPGSEPWPGNSNQLFKVITFICTLSK